MHPLAARTVRQALASGARIDLLDHFDDLRALDDAARRTSQSSTWQAAELLDQPVIVGDLDRGTPAVLYPPSLAAIEWIQECAARWFAPTEIFYSLSVAWALAFGRDPDALAIACSPRATRRLIRNWSGRLNCGLQALFHAAQELINRQTATSESAPDRNAPQGQAKAFSKRPTLFRLVAEFGENEDYWLFGPLDRLQAACDYLRRKDAAEAEAIAKASRKPEARDPDSPDVLAFVAWRAASDVFLAKFPPVSKPPATSMPPSPATPPMARDLRARATPPSEGKSQVTHG
jgi:hypothetical protein